MDSSEPSCSAHNFQPGDLIWAKMKGFPPWPAKVLERSEDAPARRIPVMFFGTLETSFMKPNDLSDYLPNRLIHEIPRKQKDFNKAVQEIRKAAGLQTDADEINFPTIERKSPPSSPTATGRKRQTSGRFLDAIMAGADPVKMRGTRSGSASTKTRSRASSNASASKLLRDMMRKERQRLNSESSTGSRRKLLNNALLGGGGAPSTSDAFGNDYADSTDFNALFGDAILGNFELNDDTKSWKSKRSRGSSKVFDDLFGRSRNRSGSASGRRSRMISLSGFSGVSDMFDELFNNPGDIDSHADQLMLTLNNMPSDGSIDRPLSPEMLNPILQAAVEFCDRCGYECRLTNGSWKCNSSHCGAIKTQGSASVAAARGIIDQPIRMPNLEIKTECLSDTSAEKSSLPAKRARKPKRNSDDDDSIDEEAARRANSINKKKKRVQVLSPRSRSHSPIPQITPSTSTGLLGRSNSPLSSSLRIRDRARPKHYKVEKTPPISASGHRHCVNCNGQVRPQMCGGNRHRWRCVDKKCRKWYGWVRSHEEIPKNTGRKKMTTFKSPITKPMKLMKPKKEEEDDGYPSLKRKVGRPSKNDIKIRLKMQKEVEEKQAAVNAARASQMALDAAATSSVPQQRRKYTKRKKDGLGAGTGGKNRDYSPFEDDVKKRSTSPLNDRSASYRPCAMEKRARWWTGEKRRVDASPEREFGTTPADSAAAFRMMAHAVRSAAVTRADEVGTVNGSLDLLMDSLLGSIGPLLANLTKLPVFQGDQELAQQLWNASAVHIPTFQ
ncbi:PWWP domain-containing protein [Caenorhabditis elegans]|uniref:PWWP domain-containing protein n=1 Tax=Caenorhabditis elegans TaxID=6239 RepID=H2KY56_CAEEL|nr:NADH dehydrogenase [ubiquinone] 1 beta subcomplex subunit 7 [Caenorhabditis elegans]CCD61212.1 NADH dehydrogenase [ubiquinone] 1 beta subcomplex subunit 7 [Caenorhabditis elegans]|eukprot:NP_491732.2 Uncharacterized protein CELE_C06A5.3 [Caenorhabditis elegans]